MILHLCIESLFNDLIVSQFELVSPGENKYIVISKDGVIRLNLNENVELVTRERFLELCGDYSLVWVHSLGYENLWACSFLTNHIVMWSSWGGDLKGKHDFLQEKAILEPVTYKKYFSFKEKVKLFMKQFSLIQEVYLLFNNTPKQEFVLREKAYKNVSYISTVLPSEKKLLGEIPELEVGYKWFNYAFLEGIVKGYYKKKVKLSKGIIVGHSSVPSLNHLDVFKEIKRLGITQDIFSPVSYGDPKYKKFVIKEGLKILDNIEFQTELISIDNYLKKLTNYHVLILNTKNQQAVGNLLTAVYIGMKVFLQREGLLYEFCKDVGLTVFSLEELSQKEVDEFLPSEIIELNRERLEEFFGEEVVLERTRGIVNLLNQSVEGKE